MSPIEVPLRVYSFPIDRLGILSNPRTSRRLLESFEKRMKASSDNT